jgi:hypothetical protein
MPDSETLPKPKHPGGRPRLFKTPAEFASKAEEYFASLEDDDKRPTLAGLCYFMGFCDKESFSHYANYGEEFSRTIKKTQLRIEADRHNRLIGKDTFTPGVIFDLKNNHGWVDKQEMEVTVNHEDRLDRIRGKLNGKRPERHVTH